MTRPLCLVNIALGLFVGCGLLEGKEQGDEAFYKATPVSRWRDTYMRIRERLGKPQQHTLTTWSVMNRFGTSSHQTAFQSISCGTGPSG